MGSYLRAIHGSGESLWDKKDPDVGTANISWFSVTGAVQAQMVLPLCLAALFGEKTLGFHSGRVQSCQLLLPALG